MNDNPEADVLVIGKDNRAKVTATRPLATFALFAYNQEAFILQAVEGALAQTYEPLEIILSDDCSSDLTFQHMVRMAKSYNGPHRIIVRRNASNSGLASHLNKVIELSAGQIIVLAAGDDISYPTRTATSVKLLGMDRSFASVLVSADIIDVKGNITGEALLSHEEACVQDVRDLLDLKAKTLGAARAFRRDVWQSFPPLQPSCPTEDTPMLLRTLIVGKSVLSSNKELAYRRHNSNLSGINLLKSMLPCCAEISFTPIFCPNSS
jgi:glycosyltransferase involved in cell wall biosynthesis